jgi:hypothetical protein
VVLNWEKLILFMFLIILGDAIALTGDKELKGNCRLFYKRSGFAFAL